MSAHLPVSFLLISIVVFVVYNQGKKSMQQTVSVSELVRTVFSQPPSDACTFKLYLVNAAKPSVDRDVYNVQMFPYLMDIFISGAMALFGPSVTPQNMTTEQFELLKKYMLSLGHKVMHRYEHNENVLIHIWFEPVEMLIGCRGNLFYQ